MLCHHLQSQLAQLSLEDLQDLQPYLQLQQVLTGFDQLLQLSMGLSLQPRPAAAGETWNGRVLVYELWEVPDSQQQQQQRQQQDNEVEATLAQRGKAAAGNTTAQRSSSSKLLGTVYLDPSGGFSTQLLLYGALYPGGLQRQEQQQQQQQQEDDSQDSASSSSSSSNRYTVPAVTVGLQSQGVLGGTHAQLALGLWEFCHELGHAVNFILSAAEKSPGITLQGQQQQSDAPHPRSAGFKAGHKIQEPYHMHAAWLPLEVLELPSTLFEAFSMDAACLQVLCRHSSSGEQLPADLAVSLAAFIKSSHYNPLMMQHTVGEGRNFGQEAVLPLLVVPVLAAACLLPKYYVSSCCCYSMYQGWHTHEGVPSRIVTTIH
jgi:hypothetical protein